MESTSVGSDRRWFGNNGAFPHEGRPGPHILEGVEAQDPSLLLACLAPARQAPCQPRRWQGSCSRELIALHSVVSWAERQLLKAYITTQFVASHHGASLTTCKKCPLRKKKVPLRKSRRQEDAPTQARARSQHIGT